MNKEYDFIVGFTLFTPSGFRTMYRHFDNLEVAKIFANNVNIKDNHKIYVDLDLYNKEKEKNKLLIEGKFREVAGKNSYIKDNYVSKDEIREKIKELEKEQENNRSDLKYAIDTFNFKKIDKISDMIVINMYLRDFLQSLLER